MPQGTSLPRIYKVSHKNCSFADADAKNAIFFNVLHKKIYGTFDAYRV